MGNLASEIKRARLTNSEIAEALNLQESEVESKLQRPGELGIGQGVILAVLIAARGGNGDIEYLYKQEVLN